MNLSEIKTGDNAAFNFLPPYDTILSNKNIFKVVSITLLSAMIERGINPRENIYALYGITDAYDSDVLQDINIIELSLTDKKFYVPLNKIESKNNEPMVAYSERMVAIKLGFIPSDEDISDLLSDIDLLIKDRLGIEAKLGEEKVTDDVVVTEPQHIARTAERDALKTAPGNYKKLYYELKIDQQQRTTKISSVDQAFINGNLI